MQPLPPYNGYQSGFLGQAHNLPLPVLTERQQADLAPLLSGEGKIIPYYHFSLLLSATRRFPYLVAANIDGNLFKKIKRKGSWKNDPRIASEHQWGDALYKAPLGDFDKGHMAKREDVQWGDADDYAASAAEATFYYTNAVPQHPSLNRKLWKRLENYILHTETNANGLRVSVFTGPVLDRLDPLFVTEVEGQQIKIPTLFWKVVFYTKSDGLLYRAGFLMGQESLLKKAGIIKDVRAEKEADSIEAKLFQQFAEAKTYQVNIATIEQLSKITMPAALEKYTDDRSLDLAIKKVDINKESALNPAILQLGYQIRGLRL
jgi:endonuclease G, mitochondrial